MPYADFRVNVYEHADNQKTITLNSKRYFYAPVALLDPQSASCVFNDVTKQNEMRFRVDMWNDKIQNQVVEYLKDFIGQQVDATQVQVVPLEKVALTSTRTSAIYTLTTDWLPYRKSIWFNLPCLFRKDCNQLAVDMRTNPLLFDHLKLLYSPDSPTSQAFGNSRFHPMHLVRDSAPTADDWTQLVARNSDTSRQLNEMKVTIEALRKTLNESKSTRHETRSRELPVALVDVETPRHSSESFGRPTEAKSTVQELKDQLADISHRLEVAKENMTKELNENKIAIKTLKKELAEITRRSADHSRQFTDMKAELLKELKGVPTTTFNPTTAEIPQFYFDCRGRSDGNYANPASKCSISFYTCAHEKAVTLNCPKGTVYHPERYQCDWISNVDGCHRLASP
ncbi:hypothetical protein OUZ56_015534 [Daphnia magna]|uniref:Chitin-binding type-2 domain-containing protein n=1 Tax=Daphnia magna TaxID=35525 RepID=A0ABR0AN42_9CRUS|nr:hypothetical protein OUZ56_015534 [Daphnia magna]